jgi:acetolactate synthase-1/2/3 large subunit
MSEQTGADYLVSELIRAGVESIFGFPGESSLPFYAATRRAGIPHVLARCERCAGYMSDTYARLTRRVSVCDAPGGVGSPFLLPALHEAYNSSVPLVALTTATPDSAVDRWATSQCDHIQMFSPVVKEVMQIRTAERLGELTQRAVHVAASGRPGPVHLDIAANLLAEPAHMSARPTAQGDALFPRYRPAPRIEEIERIIALLSNAERPLIVAGGGVLLSGAEVALTQLATTWNIPVATTFNGKGAFAETNPLSLGVIGAKGCDIANELAAEADLILWLGSKAGDKSTNYGQLPATPTQIVQVDIDPQELGRIFHPTVMLAADIRTFLEALHQELIRNNGQNSAFHAWNALISRKVSAFRQHVQSQAEQHQTLTTIALIREIQQKYADRAIILADASRACSWVGAYYVTHYAGRSVLAPRGSGSIGYALPATIAAAFVYRDRPIIGIGGDAGFAMACHELETALRLGLRFVFIILDNHSLGLLNQVAGVSLGQPDLLPEFKPTDWELVARGFGCSSATITSISQLSEALDRSTHASGPTILNAILPAHEESPDFKMYSKRVGARA